MIPTLLPVQLGRELEACVLLGAAAGAVRAFFPQKGRAAFLPDLLGVGGVLLLTQSYAAGCSEAGVLRWYMAAAAFAGAGSSAAILGIPVRAAERLLWAVLCLPVRLLHRLVPWERLRQHSARHKERRSAKRTSKKSKKNLPNQRRMLYNSNVSK